MKKAFKTLLCLLLVLVMCVPAVPAGAESLGTIVLFTNDVHCAIDGYPYLAAYRAQLIAEGYNVITVDVGDAVQGEVIGTLTEGQAVLDIMASVGYDVAVPGNHEFDYGMDAFFEIVESASHEYVCSNFVDLRTGAGLLPAYYTYSTGDLDIAFVGITTPETYTKSTPTFFQDEDGNYIYGFSKDELYETVQAAVDAAKAGGADMVIALGHTGIAGVIEGWRSTDIIANTNGIDVYLDAHSHEILVGEYYDNCDGDEVLLASTGTKLDFIGQLNIANDGRKNTELVITSSLNPSAMGAEAESAYNEVKSKIDGYKSELEYLYEEIGSSETKLAINDEDGTRIVRNGETNMGNFVADAFRSMTGADVAVVNGGGVRAEIDEGAVTRIQLMNVTPWNNEMCVLEVTGQQILYILEAGVNCYPDEKGSFLHVSGLTYELHSYVDSAVVVDDLGDFVSLDPQAEMRVQNVKIGDEYLELDKIYTLAGSCHVLTDGGDSVIFDGAPIVEKEGLKCDADMLLDYFTNTLNGLITEEQYGGIYGEGRITVISQRKGDVNGDGTVNSLDAAKILRYDSALEQIEGDALVAADVNGDGSVNSLDAAKVLMFDAGIITELSA